VLFVCTGNQCRSPMAAALLRRRVSPVRPPVAVASAGFVSAGVPAPPEVLAVMAALGLDLSDHRSRLVTPELVAAAGLVVAMARQHVLDLAVLIPDAWDRCFTFTDLLRRAELVGPRWPGEDLRRWAQRVSGDRTRASLVTLPISDDVPDPMGGYPKDYQRARDDLAVMTARLSALLSSA
jgi:protein-tyrosine-phosphatase